MYVHELRSIAPVAREAREKVTRFYWLACDLKPEACGDLDLLIQYVSVWPIYRYIRAWHWLTAPSTRS